MIINLGLDNTQLYAGCEIIEVAGRATLKTPVEVAINIIGKNIAKIVAETPYTERFSCLLTGPMAVWSYLIVFHAVVHAFGQVHYSDGRSEPVLLAMH